MPIKAKLLRSKGLCDNTMTWVVGLAAKKLKQVEHFVFLSVPNKYTTEVAGMFWFSTFKKAHLSSIQIVIYCLLISFLFHHGHKAKVFSFIPISNLSL